MIARLGALASAWSSSSANSSKGTRVSRLASRLSWVMFSGIVIRCEDSSQVILVFNFLLVTLTYAPQVIHLCLIASEYLPLPTQIAPFTLPH